MAEKRRYTVTLPDHVADAVESRAKLLGETPTEYTADVLRWWFGQGCPAVTHDESALRKAKEAAHVSGRIKPVPENLSVWSLAPDSNYNITDDNVVRKLLGEIGLTNLFAHTIEHDEIRAMFVFDNHPTHWLQFDFFKGSKRSDGDGLSFTAESKITTSREAKLQAMQIEAKRMGATKQPVFSQIPMLEPPKKSNQTPTKILTQTSH